MSAVVKLSPKMPGDASINGVDHYVEELIDDPASIRVAVLYYDVAKMTHDTDTDQNVPTIRVRRIEPIGNIEEAPKALRELVAKAEQARTGRTPIPFEIVDAGEYARSDTLDDES